VNAILTILPLLTSAIIVCNFVAFLRHRETVERFYHTYHNTDPSCLPIGHRQLNDLPKYIGPTDADIVL
jgi:hypothetical protein